MLHKAESNQTPLNSNWLTSRKQSLEQACSSQPTAPQFDLNSWSGLRDDQALERMLGSSRKA